MQRPPYEKEALRKNIDKCHETIKTFQKAIEKEYQTIAELERYIADIEKYELESGNGHYL